MTNTYQTIILSLQIVPNLNGQNNVVNKVIFSLVGNNGNGVIAQVGGNCELDTSNLSNFVPFSSLTQSQVEQWINESIGEVGLQNLKNQVDQLITNQLTPQPSFVNPPWQTS